MTEVVCRSNVGELPRAAKDLVPVLLYGTTDRIHYAYIGNGVEEAMRHFEVPATALAFDLLSIALAVTAADTFVSREEAPDRWCRSMQLDVALFDPDPWRRVASKLERALNFLSGDIWTLSFSEGGAPPPTPLTRRTVRTIKLPPSTDCVSLFSGGMDSTIGLLDLRADGHHPLLVSHAYNRDGSLQHDILRRLSSAMPRLAVNLAPGKLRRTAPEITMRARSFNFLALAVVAATMVKQATRRTEIEIIIPENGFIALNAPLTPRRVGSLSTRTTHPYFLAIIQDILNEVGESVTLRNPYEYMTKGEMLRDCRDQVALASVASETMSCSNWKRKSMACGRCVPCLIRRASFPTAGIDDESKYKTPILSWSAESKKVDDLLAVTTAIHRSSNAPSRGLASKSGPLPPEAATRQRYDEVIKRGLRELANYLGPLGLL
jgi:hypothetical protein